MDEILTAETDPVLASAESVSCETVCAVVPDAAPQAAWTERSRRSVRTEEQLLQDLQKWSGLQRSSESTLQMLEAQKGSVLHVLKNDGNLGSPQLDKTLANIESEKRKLAALKEERAKAQAKVDAFRAALAAYAPERKRRQDNIAALTVPLLEIDLEIEQALGIVRARLEERANLARMMQQQAAEIELRYDWSAGIPQTFLEAVSLDVLAASSEWRAVLVGDSEKLLPFVVIDKEFEPKETLARKAIYKFGETVLLSREESLLPLMVDRPAPGGRGWELLPPSLMPLEEFKAAKAAAKAAGYPVQYFLQRQQDERNAASHAGYKEQLRGSLTAMQGRG